jgi:hypothetical protein
MGRRDRDRIRVWAEGLVQEHGEAVARLIAVDPPLPAVTIEVTPDGPPGVTGGLTITLSERWFLEHPDDIGCVLHELSHAYMRAPDYDTSTIWLIEGLADHVRDVLGFDTHNVRATEPGKATAGYQTTADSSWLEERHPVPSRSSADGTARPLRRRRAPLGARRRLRPPQPAAPPSQRRIILVIGVRRRLVRTAATRRGAGARR